jgi:hypothetical protein
VRDADTGRLLFRSDNDIVHVCLLFVVLQINLDVIPEGVQIQSLSVFLPKSGLKLDVMPEGYQIRWPGRATCGFASTQNSM